MEAPLVAQIDLQDQLFCTPSNPFCTTLIPPLLNPTLNHTKTTQNGASVAIVKDRKRNINQRSIGPCGAVVMVMIRWYGADVAYHRMMRLVSSIRAKVRGNCAHFE